MKIVAFLPAKGSSSRVKNKNLQLLDGKPLFLHTLEKLVASNIFDDVYLCVYIKTYKRIELYYK